jgi:hypothetical protein
MKIHVSIGGVSVGGYIEVNPAKGGNIVSLPCPDNGADEILAEDICDYIPRIQLVPVILHYTKKLKSNGRLIIGGTEIKELAKAVVLGDDFELFNKMLFGSFENVWDIKSGATSIIEIVDALKKLGLKIVGKKLNGYKFIVEAVRE